MFEQFKVLAGIIEREGERERENDDRTEYDPCENNEYKDTLKKSVWYRDIQLQGCVMQYDMYMFIVRKKSKFLPVFFFFFWDEWSRRNEITKKKRNW